MSMNSLKHLRSKFAFAANNSGSGLGLRMQLGAKTRERLTTSMLVIYKRMCYSTDSKHCYLQNLHEKSWTTLS